MGEYPTIRNCEMCSRLLTILGVTSLSEGKIPQLICGQTGTNLFASVELDQGPAYLATINGVGNSTDNTFTVTANMTVTPSIISCKPADLMIEFVGDGPGGHGPHEFMYPSKYDSKDNVVFKVHGPESSFDWMLVSQEGTGCDYEVKIHSFKIDCASSEPKYQCIQSQCQLAGTGVSKDSCDSICK